MIFVTLTYPPSANRLWRNVKGKTLKSAEYRAWVTANSYLEKRPQEPIPGPYELTLRAYAPDKRRRDLGNLEKATSDFLQTVGFVTDDCNARKITLEWGEGAPARIEVRITPIMPKVAR